jgi:uncharacterized protein YprB with RNaseH-like and TPR domain
VAQDLRARLRRIKEIRKGAAAPEAPGEISGQSAAGITGIRPGSSAPPGVSPASFSPSFGAEWSPAGLLSVKRTVWPEPPAALSAGLPGALPVLLPDLIPYGRDHGGADIRDLLFFDLETTGLSGGAGTVAFLAAFGRFIRDDRRPCTTANASCLPGSAANTVDGTDPPPEIPVRLRVTQYLLLDYPGEGDFLEAALAELGAPAPSGRPSLLVTYNGKTFDAQILKIRCLMNGIRPPEYYHLDLLHPARRLWKRVLPSCSQEDVETLILGLRRDGDVPGALAPDIWFSFLKTGETGELGKICDHNVKDITGLAALFAALTRIAEDPAAAAETYRVDLESLALRWFYALRGRGPVKGLCAAGEVPGPERAQAEKLLEIAADRSCPRAAYVWAREILRRGKTAEGIKRLSLVIKGDAPKGLKAAACRTLAIDAEWRLADPQLALKYVDLFFAPENMYAGMYEDMCKRRERLLKKTAKQTGECHEYQGDGGG